MHETKTLDSQRVAIYARFSSERQRETSIDDQVYRCREHITSAGGDAERALVFTDYAISGASLDRPGFEALMSAVENKRVDAIVTEDISRISRDFADAAQLFKRLQYERIPLIGIADGVNTSARDAKLSFTLKSLVSDLYLDDLRDKTRRGLQGRARAGYSTGSVPVGYITTPEHDARGNVIGHRIKVDPDGAALVRRIFQMYRDGETMPAIGKTIGREGITPKHMNTRGRYTSWDKTTIRGILDNQKYIGVWRYGASQVVKKPGSNKERRRKRDESEVITTERPELRIIDEALWNAVQERRRSTQAKYAETTKARGRNQGRSAYLLSGLLYCGVCDGKMTISTNGSRTYYRCSARNGRDACDNKLFIREDVVRTGVLARLRALLSDRTIITHIRQEISRKLHAATDNVGEELEQHRQRLRRTEARIGRLIEHLADGNRSEYITSGLRNLEAEANAHKRAIATLEQRASTPRVLPTVDQIMATCLDLDTILQSNVKAGREHLRRIFRDGHIRLIPHNGAYIAKSQILPLAPLGIAPLGLTPSITQADSNNFAVFHDDSGSSESTPLGLSTPPSGSVLDLRRVQNQQ